MKEYIERAAALDICQKEYEERLRMADYCGDTVAWNIGGAIKSIPAADVVEVRHGRWGEYESFPLTSSLNGHPCSECGMHFSTLAIPVMKYCPNCGARMDKEAEHEVS